MRLTRQDVLDAARRGRLVTGADARAARVTRRHFLTVSATAGGGLLVAWTWTPAAAYPSFVQIAPAPGFHPNGFVRVDPDDAVTIWCRDPEMGEGVRTALPLIVADELDADWARVRVEDAVLDRERYGPQGVGGSFAVASAWMPMRNAGAAARALLVEAAARQWGVPAAECVTGANLVRHAASARRASYGSLATVAARLLAPGAPDRDALAAWLDAPPLKHPSRFSLIGRPALGVDQARIARGEPLFGIDVRLPGMRYAAIAKSPVFGGRPLKVDASRAHQVTGVLAVVEVHGLDNPTHLLPGVAVVADSTWAAFRGRDALVVEWAEGPFAGESNETLATAFDALLEKPDVTLHDTGDVDQALSSATHIVDATFDFAFVAHATLEPHNCTADVRDGQCWVRGPLQMPGAARQVVARALGMPPDRVHVAATRIGGGFGRRLLSDSAAEAAVVSRAIGRPVQVVDSREGDLAHDYYRPAGRQRLRAGVDADGRIVAWDHAIASVSRNAYRRDARPPYSTEMYGAYVGGVSTPDQLEPDLVPTRIPHARLRYGAPRTGVSTGAWRAPSHVVNAFAIETVIDELATLARRSPVDLRLELLGRREDVPAREGATVSYDPARMARVIQAAAERGGLGAGAPEGRARGLAAHYTFYSYCAQVAEVSVDEDGRITIHRIVAVVDCGRAVNPAGIEAQVQGGIIDALGAAFFAEVPIAEGRARTRSFDTYRLIRQREVPAAIETVILPSDERPTGIGEIPVPPAAPAVANAIAAAGGRRLRRMPFAREGYRL